MGAVHEQIAPGLRDAGVELVNCPDITIRHTGYEKEGESLKKNLRNLKLLAKELAERPEDPYVLFALAQAFLFCGQVEHAREWLCALWKLRETANGAASGDVFRMAAVMLSDCELKQGNAGEASAWLERAIEFFPDNWVAYFLLGERKYAAGDLERATALLGRAAEIGITPALLPLDIDSMRARLDKYLSELGLVSAGSRKGKETVM
jgi:tetratricopeptide (TPR) repeat protein